MLFKNLVLSTVAVASIPGSVLCVLEPRAGPYGTYPLLTISSDDPADPATTGYVLSHFGLNVRKMTASIDFYVNIIGMRLMFTFQPTANFSISYLAHSHGGKNGTA